MPAGLCLSLAWGVGFYLGIACCDACWLVFIPGLGCGVLLGFSRAGAAGGLLGKYQADS